MALSDILDRIRRETEARIAAIEEDAHGRAATILAEAGRAAAAAEEELAGRRHDEAATACDRIRNRARLESDRELRAAREAIVQQLLTDVAQRLAGLRATGRYEELFGRLANEASRVLPDATVAHVDPRDEERAKELFGPTVAVVGDLETGGGLVLMSPDGRTVHNTLELRLKRAESHLRRLIAQEVPELGAGLS